MTKRTNDIFSNGEDALTYTLLDRHLGDLLEGLGESRVQDDCEVFYRPSFGRGTGLGECDAIVRLGRMFFMLEAKWDRSGEVPKSKPIRLRRGQLGRSKRITTKLAAGLKAKTLLDRNLQRVFRPELGDVEITNVCVVFLSCSEIGSFKFLGQQTQLFEGEDGGATDGWRILVFAYHSEDDSSVTSMDGPLSPLVSATVGRRQCAVCHKPLGQGWAPTTE